MEQPTITEQDLRASLPDVTSSLKLRGLEGLVQIFRDGYGIPHVRAQSAWDAFFGQGFATAQDRLWHMDYDRQRAYGRWAESAGPSAVDGDKLMRRLRLGASAEADYQVISDETRAMLEAYAVGVNAFIQSTRRLPVEYKLLGTEPLPWRAVDSLAVFKVRHVLMGTFEVKLWRGLLVAHLGVEKAAELLRGYPEGSLLIVPPGAEYIGPALPALEELRRCAEAVNWLRETDSGSNSWALTGKRTRTAKPLVCGDSHRALDTPGVYYQNHVACPDFDAIGFSFPGLPAFPHFGHNGHVAWCITHAGADYQDLYVERFKEGDSSQYLFKDEWEKAEVHHETIQVRGSQPVDMDVTVTRHGPIIAGDPSRGHALAFRYTATASANNWADAMVKQLYVKSVDDLEQAMSLWVDPCNNYVSADVQGTASYLTRGKVPIRSKANRWLPVPGWTGEHEWEGFVPFEAMPRIRNPETGCIVTANNRIVEKDEPYYIGMDYVPDFRARRIYERLRNMTGATADDMSVVHAERVSIPAVAYTCLLRDIEPIDDFSARARDLLTAWDGRMDRDRIEPTIYSAFRQRLTRIVLEPVFGPLARAALEGSDRGAPRHVLRLSSRMPDMARTNDRSLLPVGTEWKEVMAKALSEGVAYLQSRLGDDISTWTWGSVHKTRPQHPLSPSFPAVAKLLDPPTVSTHGDGDTPLQGGYSAAEPYIVAGVSVNRYIFDLADLANSRWSVPLGSSGHPGSAHYADQLDMWADVRLIPMLCDWTAIQKEAESRQGLSPRK